MRLLTDDDLLDVSSPPSQDALRLLAAGAEQPTAAAVPTAPAEVGDTAEGGVANLISGDTPPVAPVAPVSPALDQPADSQQVVQTRFGGAVSGFVINFNPYDPRYAQHEDAQGSFKLPSPGRYLLTFSIASSGAPIDLVVYEGQGGVGNGKKLLEVRQEFNTVSVSSAGDPDSQFEVRYGSFGTYSYIPLLFTYADLNDGARITVFATQQQPGTAFGNSFSVGITQQKTDNPLAVDDRLKIRALHVEKTIDVLANDQKQTLPIDASTLKVVDQPRYGSVTIKDGKFVYVQNDSSLTKTHEDQFTYTVADTAGLVSNVAKVRIGVGPDPFPLAVDGDLQVSDDQQSATATAGATPIAVGREDAGGLAGLITTAVGSVTVTDSGVALHGALAYAGIGVHAALFQGDVTFSASTQTATLTDANVVTADDRLKVAGQVVVPTTIKIDTNRLLIGGSVLIPDELPLPGGKIDLPGADGLVIDSNGVGLAATEIPLQFGKAEWKLKGVITIKATKLTLKYDLASDALRLQGTLEIAQPWNDSFHSLDSQQLALKADFSGENYIQLKNSIVDVKGSLSIENARLTPTFRIDKALIKISTDGGHLKTIGGEFQVGFGAFGAGNFSLKATAGWASEQFALDYLTVGFVKEIPLGTSGLYFQAGEVGLHGLAPNPPGTTTDANPLRLTLDNLELTEGPKEIIDIPDTFFTSAGHYEFAAVDLKLNASLGVDKQNGDFIGTAGASLYFVLPSFLKVDVSGTLNFTQLTGSLMGSVSAFGGGVSGTGKLVFNHSYWDLDFQLNGAIPDAEIFGSFAGKPVAGFELHVRFSDDRNNANDYVDLSRSITAAGFAGQSETWRWVLSDLLSGNLNPTHYAGARPPETVPGGAPLSATADTPAPQGTGFILPYGQVLALTVHWTQHGPDVAPGSAGLVESTDNYIFQLPLLVQYRETADGPVVATYHEGAEFDAKNIHYENDLSSSFQRTLVVGFAETGVWSVAIDRDAVAAMGIDPDSLILGDVSVDAITQAQTPTFEVYDYFAGSLIYRLNAGNGDTPVIYRLYADNDASGHDGQFVGEITATGGFSAGYLAFNGLTGGPDALSPHILTGTLHFYAEMITQTGASSYSAYSDMTIQAASADDLSVTATQPTPAGVGEITRFDVTVTNNGDTPASHLSLNGTFDGGSVLKVTSDDPAYGFDRGQLYFGDNPLGAHKSVTLHFSVLVADVQNIDYSQGHLVRTLSDPGQFAAHLELVPDDVSLDGTTAIADLPNQDPNPFNDVAEVGFLTANTADPATQAADLSVSIAPPRQVVSGTSQYLGFAVTLHNDGPEAARLATVTVNLDGPFSTKDAFLAGAKDDWFEITHTTGNTYVITLRDALASGDSVTLPFLFNPIDSGAATITASVSHPGQDADPTNDHATVGFDYVALPNPGAKTPDLDLQGSAVTSSEIVDGQTLHYVDVTLIERVSDALSAGSTVRMNLPAGATLLSQSAVTVDGVLAPTGLSVDATSRPGALVWDTGAVTAGHAAAVKLHLLLPDATTPVFTAEIVTAASGDVDATPGNGSLLEDDLVVMDTAPGANRAPVAGTPTGGNGGFVVPGTAFILPGDPYPDAGHLYDKALPAEIATDADGDPLTFKASGAWPSWLHVVNGGPEIAGVVADQFALFYGYAVDIFDGQGHHTTARFASANGLGGVNDPPYVVHALPDVSAVAGRDYTYHVVQDFAWRAYGVNDPAFFDDSDNGSNTQYNGYSGYQPLTYTVEGLPAWLTFAPSDNTLKGHPGAGDTGTYTLTLVAHDDGSVPASDSFVLTVEGAVPDHAPVVEATLPDLTAVAGQSLSYVIPDNVFSDADGDVLSIAATGLPNWLSFDGASRTLSGTAPLQPSGDAVLTITAYDGRGGAVGTPLHLAVANPNHAPTFAGTTLQATPAERFDAYSPLLITRASLLAFAADPDSGQTLTLEIGTGPSHGTLVEGAGGDLLYTPDNDFVGIDSFQARVSDGLAESLFSTVSIKVSRENIEPYGVDFPHYAITDPDAPVTTDFGQTLLDFGVDPDGGPQPLGFQILSASAQGAFTVTADGHVSYTAPTAGFIGHDTLIYRLFDGADYSAPILRYVDIIGADGKQSPLVSNFARDLIVGETISDLLPEADQSDSPYALYTAPLHGQAVVERDGHYTYTPDPGYSGYDVFKFAVVDGEGRTSVEAAILHIRPLIGTTDPEVFNGTPGDDTAHGGIGNDTLYGFDGDDALFGDENDDYIDGGAGLDTLHGGPGDDTLIGGAGHNLLYGDAGNDDLSTGEDGSVQDGGFGNDTLHGGAGVDILDGGYGDDRLMGAGGADQLNGGDGNDTLSGGDGNDTLDGGAGDDVISGDGGDDLISGGSGNSTLNGGDGADVIHGGLGHNTIDGGAGDDIVYGGPEVFVLGEYQTDQLHGGDGNDTIHGGGGFSAGFYGEGGDDVILTEGTRSSLIYGGDGNDTIVDDNGGYSNVYGEAGDDHITVIGDRFDQVFGGDGADTIQGGRGNDILSGDQGSDVIDGGAGDDTIGDGLRYTGVYVPDYSHSLATDQDVFHGGDGNDTVYGGAGTDTLYGDEGDDKIVASLAGSHIYGGEGDDNIQGRDGDDVLDGGAGNDTFITFEGVDVVYGGGGADTITLGPGYQDRSFGTAYGGDGNDNITIQGERAVVDGGAGDDVVTLLISLNPEDYGAASIHQDLDGGDGIDTFDLTDIQYREGATVDLAVDVQTTGPLIGYRIVNFENVIGETYGTINTNQAADTLLGNAAANRLEGRGGNDHLDGRGGDDALFGGDGDDVIIGGAGGDQLYGGAGADVFVYLQSTDSPNNANDDINDFETGIDRISLSAVDGGYVHVNYTADGQSFVYFDSDGAGGWREVVQVHGRVSGGDLDVSAATDIVFTAPTDGSVQDMTGSAGGDRLFAGSGGGILNGLGGLDVYALGAGRDRVVFSSAADSPNGTPDIVYGFTSGQDVIDVSSTPGEIYLTYTPEGDTYLAFGDFAGQVIIHGIVKPDDIATAPAPLIVEQGGPSPGSLYAGDTGGGREVRLFAGSAGDTFYAGADHTTMTGGSGGDRFVFSDTAQSPVAQPDVIFGFVSGQDKIDVSGVPGEVDLSFAADGKSYIRFGDYAGQIIVNDVQVTPGDIIASSGSPIVVFGGGAGATLYGGGSGEVRLFASDAGNTLVSGTGNEVMRGGAGADTFLFGSTADSSTARPDVIYDFQHGLDHLDISAADAGQVTIRLNGGGETVVDFGGVSGAAATGRIYLHGTLGADDLVTSAAGRNLSFEVIASGQTALGGAGADSFDVLGPAATLTGGAGADLFDFSALGVSTPGASALITDFDPLAGDKIALDRIDADPSTAADDAFHLVSSFTGQAGEAMLVYDAGRDLTTFSGDSNADGVADFLFQMSGRHDTSTGFVF